MTNILNKYLVSLSFIFAVLFTNTAQADTWTTIYASDFTHIQMPPVAAPVTWNTGGTSGSFSSEILDGTQGMQHLLGEMLFPEDAETTGETIPIAVNCVFNDLFNKGTSNEMTDEEMKALGIGGKDAKEEEEKEEEK